MKSMINSNVEVEFSSEGSKARQLIIARRGCSGSNRASVEEEIVFSTIRELERLRDFLDVCIAESSCQEERYELFSDCYLTFPRADI